MKSMTGYGKAETKISSKIITVEIKALNSKQMDIYMRLPNIYKEKEIEIRKIIGDSLIRGKVDCFVGIEMVNDGKAAVINDMVVKQYYNQLTKVRSDLNLPEESLLATVLRLPESLKPEKEELVEEEWNILKTTIVKALNALNNFRTQEGKCLQKDVELRIRNIESLLQKTEKFEASRIKNIKTRISDNLNSFFEEIKVDKNRMEQEILYYIEKLDINEEKVRLRNHCKYFQEVIDNKDKLEFGKKLGFISQELGREINTIGSKANDFNIQKYVVLMKDELEKIKEQLMNVL